MEEPLCPEVPAPLHGHAFLQASHFQLGFDHRPEGSTVVSPHRFNYPPHWGTYLRKPILPPQCAGVLNQDLGRPWETRPEYLASYPAWPVAARPDICPPASHLRMHADPRHQVFTSTTQENYACPAQGVRLQPHRVDKWDDSIPGGDPEKVPLPPSLSHQSYRAHGGLPPPVTRAPNQHLGSDSTLKGDGGVCFGSSYQAQYMGEWAPPPKRCHEGPVSVVFGDPRCREPGSEHWHAYAAPHPADLCHRNTERATRQLFQTNIQAGDGRQRFSTTTAESFPQQEAGHASISYPKRNMSSILRGDESAQGNKGNVTMSSFYYREPSLRNLKLRQLSSPNQLAMCLGDRRLGSFSTTHQLDYWQWSPKAHKGYPQSKSSISFGFPDRGTFTTTHDMLVPHQSQKDQIPEELLQKVELEAFSTSQRYREHPRTHAGQALCLWK